MIHVTQDNQVKVNNAQLLIGLPKKRTNFPHKSMENLLNTKKEIEKLSNNYKDMNLCIK